MLAVAENEDLKKDNNKAIEEHEEDRAEKIVTRGEEDIRTGLGHLDTSRRTTRGGGQEENNKRRRRTRGGKDRRQKRQQEDKKRSRKPRPTCTPEEGQEEDNARTQRSPARPETVASSFFRKREPQQQTGNDLKNSTIFLEGGRQKQLNAGQLLNTWSERNPFLQVNSVRC